MYDSSQANDFTRSRADRLADEIRRDQERLRDPLLPGATRRQIEARIHRKAQELYLLESGAGLACRRRPERGDVITAHRGEARVTANTANIEVLTREPVAVRITLVS